MARPREAGGLAEASRLLQEGLQLLAQREREVDRLLEDARERALVIRERAQQHATRITEEAEAQHAELERQRAELEALVATLRSEVEALRSELAELRSKPAQPPASEAPEASAEPNGVALDDTDVPRWGRHSTALGEPQAVRTKSSRTWLAWLKR